MDDFLSVIKTYAQAYGVQVVVTMDENNLTIGAKKEIKGLLYGDYARFTLDALPENKGSLIMLFADTLETIIDKITAEGGGEDG